MPKYHVTRFQVIAPARPPRITHWSTTARVHHALAHRARHLHPEAEGGHEVEEGGPRHRLHRGEHAGRHHGGDGVGRVVEPVDVVEGKRDQDDEADQQERPAHPRGAGRFRPS